MAIGNNLKRILSEKKISIKQLAEQSGVSLNTLYSITKRDPKNIMQDTLTVIADSLGVSIFDITVDMDELAKDVRKMESIKEILSVLGYRIETIITGTLSFDPDESERLAEEAAKDRNTPIWRITKGDQEPIELSIRQRDEMLDAVEYAVQCTVDFSLNKFKKDEPK